LWRGRDEDTVWIAAGEAGTFDSLEDARAVLRAMTLESFAPRAFCWVAFDPARALEGRWSGFSSRRSVLPGVLVRWRDGEAEALIHEEAEGLFSRLQETLGDSEPETPMPALARSESSMGREEWNRAVRSIREEIRRGRVQKVVLARAQRWEFDGEVPAAGLLRTLAETSPNSFVFAVRAGDSVFLGASPELLFRKEGPTLQSDCLAGTRRRGANEEEDAQLERELQNSGKDVAEHNFVREFLREHYHPWCDSVTMDATPHISKLTAVQHLHTTVQGILKGGVTLDEILSGLHPTPAVCGTPREAARRMIARVEPVSRGLYAGTIGWVDAEKAEFAVMIRSAFVKGDTVCAYAGAGITLDSDPDSEWKETEQKLQVIRDASGVTSP
jgi:menaquinone-specific isochorismate synthase